MALEVVGVRVCSSSSVGLLRALTQTSACIFRRPHSKESRPRLSTIPTALPLLTLWMLYACKQTRQVDTDAGNSSERLRVLTDTIEAGAGHGSVLGLDQLEVRFVLLRKPDSVAPTSQAGEMIGNSFVTCITNHGAVAIGQQGR